MHRLIDTRFVDRLRRSPHQKKFLARISEQGSSDTAATLHAAEERKMRTTIRGCFFLLLLVLPLCLIAEIVQAVTIIEPNFTKFTPDRENRASPLCGAGGAPVPCVPNRKGRAFDLEGLNEGKGWPPVWNNTGVDILDIHIQIEGPADATWGDTNDADKVVGKSDIFPNGCTVSANGKTIDCKGTRIKKGEDPFSGKQPPADSFRPHFLGISEATEDITLRAKFTVPEPSTLLLVGSSLAGLGAAAWRRHRRK
jgi:hypothetical protein